MLLVGALPGIAQARSGTQIRTVAGHGVSLNTGATLLPPGGKRVHYTWKILKRPAGSKATLKRPHAVSPRLTPDKPGYYRLRLTMRIGHRTSSTRVTVASQMSYPPLGAPVDTMAQNGGAIRVGSYTHSFNPFPCNSMNAVIVDRTTLAVPYGKSLTGSANSAQTLLTEIKTLMNNGTVGSHPIVILSVTLQNPNTNCTTVNAGFNSVLTAIGAKPMSAITNGTGQAFSVVGLYGGAPGTAWQNDAKNEPNDLLQGQIQGYFQNYAGGRFYFVPRERVPVDLDAPNQPNTPSLQNTIQVGGTSYPSGPLIGTTLTSACGTGGFQIEALNAMTLASVGSKTFATNGCGMAFDTAGEEAMIAYLQGLAQSPSVPKLMVMIQSIGTPIDSNTNTGLWQQLAGAVVGVGGTPTVFATDTGSYSLIGSVGMASFPLAESSQTATGRPAHMSAVLKRDLSYAFEPSLTSSSGPFGFGFATTTYQTPQPFQDTSGEQKALAYISTQVLGLPWPETNPSQFCYDPPQPDVRYAYCYVGVGYQQWQSWVSTLRGMTYPTSQAANFSSSDWTAVTNQLAGPAQKGMDTDEFKYVSTVRHIFDSLITAKNSNITVALAVAQNEAKQIKTALAGKAHTNAAGQWLDLFGNILNTIGAIGADAESAGTINLLAAALYLGEDATGSDGTPSLGQFSVAASNFDEALATAYQNAATELYHVRDIVLTDAGKMRAFYNNQQQFFYNPTNSVNRAARLGAARFAYQSLLPAAYKMVELPRSSTNNSGVTDASKYTCQYQVRGKLFAAYNAFGSAPLSAQLLGSHLYVLVQRGAALPDGTTKVSPPTAPSSLTHSLFLPVPYASSGGVITQLGMYKPWFYSQAYNLASAPSVQCQ